MTARQLYDGVLIELHKENAPNILLEDFNYFANKAVNQYINKRYNIYDINQQTTDDLRVLKATALLPVNKVDDYSGLSLASNATYEVILPQDYLHILNCICIYKVNKTYRCYNAGDTWRAAATRLTADAYSQVLDNFWTKPSYKRPYYYIHNVNYPSNAVYLPTNPVRFNKPVKPNDITEIHKWEQDGESKSIERTITKFEEVNWESSKGLYTYKRIDYIYNSDNHKANPDDTIESDPIKVYVTPKGTDATEVAETHVTTDNSDGITYGVDGNGNLIVSGDFGLKNIIKLKGYRTDTDLTEAMAESAEAKNYSNVERGAQIRYGNVSLVRLEIRYGTDDSVFALNKVYIDYIKAPQNIRLTQEEIDYTEDKSQMLEFPDYVCQEIINELVHLIMENITDQRLQTHPIVTLSIANPAQQLTEPVAQLS